MISLWISGTVFGDLHPHANLSTVLEISYERVYPPLSYFAESISHTSGPVRTLGAGLFRSGQSSFKRLC